MLFQIFSSAIKGRICQCILTSKIRHPQMRDAKQIQKLYSTQTQHKVPVNDVHFDFQNGTGVISLNRPNVANAMTVNMIRSIYLKLRNWEASRKLIIIKAEGNKGFCSGFDIKELTNSMKLAQGLHKYYFKHEMRLISLISNIEVPYIALVNGITIGSGIGLTVHARYRVATENASFCLPEAKIGLVPSGGTSFFFPRLQGKLGNYLALTGTPIKGADLYKAGIATHLCNSSMLPELQRDLISLDSKANADIETVLQKYNDQFSEPEKTFSLEDRRNDINKLFDNKSVEEIISNLKDDASEWSLKTLDTLSKMSPTSLKLILKLLETGKYLNLAECLQKEFRVNFRCCENHDFNEGVRAAFVDKDNNPQWKPRTLQDIIPESLDNYFEPLNEYIEQI